MIPTTAATGLWSLLGALASGALLLVSLHLYLREARRRARREEQERLARLARRCQELERALVEGAAERQELQRRLALLGSLWRELDAAGRPDGDPGAALVALVRRALQAARAALFVCTERGLERAAVHPADLAVPPRYAPRQGWVGWAAAHGLPLTARELERLPPGQRAELAAAEPLGEPWDVYLPLRLGAEVLGVLALDGLAVGRPERERLADLALPAAAALALRRARLELRRRAALDPETGLLHRRAFRDRLEERCRARDAAPWVLAGLAAAEEEDLEAWAGLTATLAGASEPAGRIGATTLALCLRGDEEAVRKRLDAVVAAAAAAPGGPAAARVAVVPAGRPGLRGKDLLRRLEARLRDSPEAAAARSGPA